MKKRYLVNIIIVILIIVTYYLLKERIHIYPLDEIYLPIEKDDKWGYKNLNNEWVIEPIFDRAYMFSEDLARVELDHKTGFINSKGEFYIKPIYDSVYTGDFKDGTCVVRIERDEQFDVSIIDLDKKCVLSKKNVNRVFEINNYVVIMEFTETFEEFISTYDRQGNLINSFKVYFLKGFFVDEVSGFQLKEDGDWGLIDIEGNIITEPIYSYVFPYFRNGLSIVGKDEAYYCINEANEMIFKLNSELDYYSIFGFDENILTVHDKTTDQYGYISMEEEGKVIVPSIYDYGYNFRGGLAAVKKDEKWGYVNKEGEVVIDFIFDSAHLFDPSTGYAMAEIDDEMVYIDYEGNIIVDSH
jgi:hypothetical protein